MACRLSMRVALLLFLLLPGFALAGGDPDDDITVANLNLLHGFGCSDPPGQCRLEDRVDLFYSWLVSAGCPDFATLQEVIIVDGLLSSRDLVAAQAESRCPFPYEVVFEPSQTIDEELILSRYPVLERETVDLHSAVAPAFTRHVLRARIDHPARGVDLYTTHFSSGSDLATSDCDVGMGQDGEPKIPCPAACVSAGAVTVRDCQAVQLADHVFATRDPDGVALVTGDFNARPDSFAYAHLTSRGFLDAYSAVGNPECDPDSGVGCTSGRGSDPELESPVANTASRIDYVFVLDTAVGSSCADGLDTAADLDGDGTATRHFADDPNPFAPSCGPLPQEICWPSDHEGVEVDLNCKLRVQLPAKRKCIQRVNALSARLARKQGEAGIDCLRFAAQGRTRKLVDPGAEPPQQATASACLDNDVEGEIARAHRKLAAGLADRCEKRERQIPDFGRGSPEEGALAAVEAPKDLLRDLLGSDLDGDLANAALDAEGARCQRRLAKSAQALFDALWKQALQGKRKALRGELGLEGASFDRPAVSAETLAAGIFAWIQRDSRERVGDVAAALARTGDEDCGGAKVAARLAALFPGRCGAVGDAVELAACAGAAARCRFCESLEAVDGLELGCDDFDDSLANASCADG